MSFKKRIVKVKVNSKMSLTTIFNSCKDTLRNNESCVGDKALATLTHFLTLKLIEPLMDQFNMINTIDQTDEPIHIKERLKEVIYFSKIAKQADINIPTIMQTLWKKVLCKNEYTKFIYQEGKTFLLRKQETYIELVEKLASADFSKIEPDILGQAYEDTIQRFSKDKGSQLGQFFTPPSVKKIVIDLVDVQVNEDGSTESIYDPAMGTGGFLISMIRDLAKKARTKEIDLNYELLRNGNLTGREIDPDTFQLAVSNLIINSKNNFKLELGDSMCGSKDYLSKINTKEYDVIIANPPFGLKKDYDIRRKNAYEYSDENGQIFDETFLFKQSSSTPMFIQLMIKSLKINGRCGVVLPAGEDLSSASVVDIAFRKYLLKTCDLQQVIYLPKGAFKPYTSIKTCIFYFVKKQMTNEDIPLSQYATQKISFYEYDTKMVNKKHLSDKSIQKLSEKNYSLDIDTYREEVRFFDNLSKDIQVKTLGEVCEFKNGHAFKSTDFQTKNSTNFGVLKITSIQNGYVQEDKITDYVDKNDKLQSFEVKYDDILIALTGATVGKMGINKLDKITYLNQRVCKVVCSNKLNKMYFYYWYMYFDIISEVLSLSNGSAQDNISTKTLEKIKIPIPPLEMQQHIVDEIESQTELHKKSTQTLKDMYQLYEREKIFYMKRNLKHCEVKTLREVCTYEIGGTPLRSNSTFWNDGTNIWVSVSELNNNIIIDSKEKITNEGIKNSSVKLFPIGTVLFSFKLSIGKTAIAGVPLYTNEAITGINSKDTNYLLNKYIYYYLSNTDYSINATGLIGNGSLNKKSIGEIKIPIPPLEKQIAFVNYCETYLAKIEELKENEKRYNEEFNFYIKSLFDLDLDRDEDIDFDRDGDESSVISTTCEPIIDIPILKKKPVPRKKKSSE